MFGIFQYFTFKFIKADEAKQLEVQLEQYALSVAQSRKVLDQVTQHKSLWERMYTLPMGYDKYSLLDRAPATDQQ